MEDAFGATAVGVASYAAATVAFLALTILLAVSWRGRAQGVRLIGASAMTALWAALLTLQAWRDNVEAAWERLDPRYDERFRRMWRFYLAASMASFRTRHAQLWQLVLSPRGVPGGYLAPR